MFPEDKKPKKMDPSLKSMIEKMEANLLSQIKMSEEKINSNIDRKLEAFEAKIENRLGMIEGTLNNLKEENVALRAENKRLSTQMNLLDRDRRRNSVIISGIEANNPAEAAVKINNALETSGVTPTPAIKNVRILRLKSGQKMVGTFQSLEEKLAIMRNKRNIKTAEGNPVFIDDDLTPEDSEIQFMARQKARELRKTGKEVKIGNGQIKVDGAWLRYDAETGDFIMKGNSKKDFQ